MSIRVGAASALCPLFKLAAFYPELPLAQRSRALMGWPYPSEQCPCQHRRGDGELADRRRRFHCTAEPPLRRPWLRWSPVGGLVVVCGRSRGLSWLDGMVGTEPVDRLHRDFVGLSVGIRTQRPHRRRRWIRAALPSNNTETCRRLHAHTTERFSGKVSGLRESLPSALDCITLTYCVIVRLFRIRYTEVGSVCQSQYLNGK